MWTEIERVVINSILLSPTTAFRIGAIFVPDHMAIALPLRKLFTEHQKPVCICLEAVHDKVPELLAADL